MKNVDVRINKFSNNHNFAKLYSYILSEVHVPFLQWMALKCKTVQSNLYSCNIVHKIHISWTQCIYNMPVHEKACDGDRILKI